MKDLQTDWREYVKTRETRIRNKLIEAYLPMVLYSAERFEKKLPKESFIDRDDLIQSGFFGLVEAIENFDPDRGIKFETFGAHRIKGYILDELRRLDPIGRTGRNYQSKIDLARESLEIKLVEAPGLNETLREASGEFLNPIKLLREYAQNRNPISICDLTKSRYDPSLDEESDLTYGKYEEPDIENNPQETSKRKSLKEFITRGFDRRERLILTLYYYEEMTMAEIAKVIDLSESRISQIHSDIMKRLRERVKGKEEAF